MRAIPGTEERLDIVLHTEIAYLLTCHLVNAAAIGTQLSKREEVKAKQA